MDLTWTAYVGNGSSNGHVALRANRRADENWWVPGTTDFEEMVKHARRCLVRTGKPQRIHNHRQGHLCTARCEVLEPAPRPLDPGCYPEGSPARRNADVINEEFAAGWYGVIEREGGPWLIVDTPPWFSDPNPMPRRIRLFRRPWRKS